MVRICLIIVDLENLDILASEIYNAYLTGAFREKFWMRAEPEFVNLEEKVLVVKMALYSLKYSGAAFRECLVRMLDDIGFRSSIANTNFCMRAATKPTGETYYEYILCYFDGVICISNVDRQTMGEIQNNVKFKNNNIEDPDFYLGDSLKKK